MTDQTRAVAASIVGAVIGGVAGYMVFTPQGRELRRRMEPALEDLARELNHFRSTLTRAGFMANESWRLLNDAMSETGRAIMSEPGRTTTPHQTTPF